MAMIDLERIAAVLTPWLGSELISRMPRVLTEIQRRLSVFTAGQSDLGQLAESLEGLVYTAVRKETDAAFLITLADQSRVRMETEDFAVIADELLWLLFEQFPTDARHLMLLRDFSLKHTSLSAIRALYERYREYETNDELKALRRVARGSFPAYRWQSWLGYEYNQ